MNREGIITRLRENQAALRARDVAHAALFGSRARGDARPDSDTDIMVEIDPEAPVTIYGWAALRADTLRPEGRRPQTLLAPSALVP